MIAAEVTRTPVIQLSQCFLRQNKSFAAMKAMDTVVPSRVIQDLIHFPPVIFLAFRTDNLKHFPFPLNGNISRAVRFVKAISGRFFGGESLPDPLNEQLNTSFQEYQQHFTKKITANVYFLKGNTVFSFWSYWLRLEELNRCAVVLSNLPRLSEIDNPSPYSKWADVGPCWSRRISIQSLLSYRRYEPADIKIKGGCMMNPLRDQMLVDLQLAEPNPIRKGVTCEKSTTWQNTLTGPRKNWGRRKSKSTCFTL